MYPSAGQYSPNRQIQDSMDITISGEAAVKTINASSVRELISAAKTCGGIDHCDLSDADGMPLEVVTRRGPMGAGCVLINSITKSIIFN